MAGKRSSGTETIEAWCDRLGLTFRKMPLQTRSTVGYPKGSKHYNLELDRDGADAKLILQWTDDPAGEPVKRPVEVIRDILWNARNVEDIPRRKEEIIASYSLEDPDTQWPELFRELVEQRDRFIAWVGRIEYDKLCRCADGAVESGEQVA